MCGLHKISSLADSSEVCISAFGSEKKHQKEIKRKSDRQRERERERKRERESGGKTERMNRGEIKDVSFCSRASGLTS